MMTVTAFGPFGSYNSNPSEILGRAVFGDKLVVLPVSFSAVDDFVNDLPTTGRLLMLGVSGGAKSIKIERNATSKIGEALDVCNERRVRDGPESVSGTLFRGMDPCACWANSNDAGDYLCNYLYYEATSKRPDLETGFVHVPPFSMISMPVQAVRLKRLANLLSRS